MMYADLAPRLRARGWRSVIPLIHGQKRPAISGWEAFNKRPPSDKEIAGWVDAFPDAGIGLAAGPDSIVAVDLDWTDPTIADAAKTIAAPILGPTPLVRIGRPPKLLVIYRRDAGLNLGGKAFGGFEIFHNVGQLVMFGIHPNTGLPYRWPRGTPLDYSPADLPIVTERQVLDLIAALQSNFPAPHVRRTVPARSPSSPSASPSYSTGVAREFLPLLRRAPDRLAEATRIVADASAPGLRYPTAFGMVVALAMIGSTDADIRAAVIGPYLQHFTDRRERADRLKAIETGLRWARSVAGPDENAIRADPALVALQRGWRKRRPPPPPAATKVNPFAED